MITLTKYENKYSRNIFEYKVLEREKIEEIIDNLDVYEMGIMLTEEAVKYSGQSAYAFAEMCVDNGEVCYEVQFNNTESAEPNLWLRLMDFGDVQRLADVPKDYLLYEEEIDEVHELMDKDSDLDFRDACAKFMEDNDIDIYDRLKEYYIDYFAHDLKLRSDIKESLDAIYTND